MCSARAGFWVSMARSALTVFTMSDARPLARYRLLAEPELSQLRTSSVIPALKMAVHTLTASTVAGELIVRFPPSSWSEAPCPAMSPSRLALASASPERLMPSGWPAARSFGPARSTSAHASGRAPASAHRSARKRTGLTT
jgi:hypothetical protein